MQLLLPFAAPEDCTSYYRVSDEPIVIRTFNFPGSRENGLIKSQFERESTICIASSNSSRIVRLELRATGGGFHRSGFVFNWLTGSSHHDQKCPYLYVELVNKTTGWKRYCGAAFTDEDCSKVDDVVNFESTGDLFAIKIPKTTRLFYAGFRIAITPVFETTTESTDTIAPL